MRESEFLSLSGIKLNNAMAKVNHFSLSYSYKILTKNVSTFWWI